MVSVQLVGVLQADHDATQPLSELCSAGALSSARQPRLAAITTVSTYNVV